MQRKELISLDALKISINLRTIYKIVSLDDEININKALKLKPTARKNVNFHNVFDVNLDGLHIGELYTEPNKKSMDANLAIFKFDNCILYTSELLPIYKKLKYCLGFTFKNVNNLDIFIDKEIEPGKGFEFAKKYTSGKWCLKGNSVFSVQYRHNKIRYAKLGSEKSDKFMRFYYKKQELAVSNKDYIREFWDKNNLDHSGEVFRSELSLKSERLKDLKILDADGSFINPFCDESVIELIQDANFLHDTFFAETQNFAVFYDSKEFAEKKRANLVKQTYLFSNIKPENVTYFIKYVRDRAEKAIHKVKILSKFLYQLSYESGARVYEDISEELTSFFNLQAWKQARAHEWDKELNAKVKNKKFKQYSSLFMFKKLVNSFEIEETAPGAIYG